MRLVHSYWLHQNYSRSAMLVYAGSLSEPHLIEIRTVPLQCKRSLREGYKSILCEDANEAFRNGTSS